MTSRAARNIKRDLSVLSQRLSKRADQLSEEAMADREAAEDSLFEFVKQAWHVLEPWQELKDNWHIELICEHLEAMTRGDIQNLLINIPPGMMKSLLVSVFWPTWEWGPAGQPWRRYIFSAYGANLSVRDNARARRLMQSDWYQERWGFRFEFSDHVNAKVRYENYATGMRFATSVGAAGTGERADTVVFDDPHKLEHWRHPDLLAQAIVHKNEVLNSRGIGDHSRKVIMMQRVAHGDVTEDALRQELEGGTSWRKVILPMRYDPDFQVVVGNQVVAGVHERDPRTRPGELLHPNLQGEQYVREEEISFGPRASATLQQNPSRDIATAFKEKDLRHFYVIADEMTGAERYGLDTDQGWKVYEEHEVWRVIGVDLAASLEETADYFCAEVWGITPDMELLLLDMVHDRIEGPDQIPTLWSLQSQWRAHVILIENTAYQLSFVQSAVREGMPAEGVRADKDKFVRSIPLQTLVRNHRVYLRAGAAFTPAMKEELLRFPGPGKKDRVDPAAYVARQLTMGELSAPDPVDRTEHQRASRPMGPFGSARRPPFGGISPFG